MLGDVLTHLFFKFIFELIDRQSLALVLDHDIVFLEVNLNFVEAEDVLVVFVVLDGHTNIMLLNRFFELRFELSSSL